MKSRLLTTLIFLFIVCASYAQIDAGLLVSLTPATTAEMNAISGSILGSLVYNTTESSVYQYNGSAWIAVTGSATGAWNINGTAGTNSVTDFLGTTDAQDLVLKSNNTEKLRLVQDRGQLLINQATIFNSHPLVIRANGVDVLAFEDNTGTPKWHWNLLGNGLNFVESGVADYRLFLENGGQVGVNTNTPSEQLDVNGGARVRSLNTANANDEILAADATGVLKRSKVNFGGRWTNSDTGTNLNVNNTLAPIFGNEDYKDDGTQLYEVIGNTLIVKESGRYDIRANISLLVPTNRARTNVNARIAINGTSIGARAATGYVRWANGQQQSSLHMNEILNLNANDVITIVTTQEATSGTVRFSGANESSFNINKVR